MHSKSHVVAAFLVSLMLAPASPAVAEDNPQSNVPGRYMVEATQVATSCGDDKPVVFGANATLVASVNEEVISVQLPKMPLISGPLHRRGKFRAQGMTSQADAKGRRSRFSATGRFDARTVRMVLVAEYVKDGKTQCSQSWNISGKR